MECLLVSVSENSRDEFLWLKDYFTSIKINWIDKKSPKIKLVGSLRNNSVNIIVIEDRNELKDWETNLKKYAPHKLSFILVSDLLLSENENEVLELLVGSNIFVFPHKQFIGSLRQAVIGMINNFEQEDSLKSEKVLKKMALELDELGRKVHQRLVEIKEHYQSTVARRYQIYRTIKMVSKFNAGESLGGEFFDCVCSGNKVSLILTRASSYKVSGLLIKLFSEYKEKKFVDLINFRSFIKEFVDEIIQYNLPSSKSLVHMLVCQFDLDSKIVEGYLIGGHEILFSDGNYIRDNFDDIISLNFENFYFKKEFSEKSRVVFLSSGLRANFKEKFAEKELNDVVLNKMHLNQFDFLDEVLFSLKKGDVNSFQTYDSSLISFEVI